MNWFSRLTVAALTTASLATAVMAKDPPKPKLTEAEAKDRAALVDAGNSFGLAVYGKIRGGDGNIFFSPFSISSALSMTEAGARNGTAVQMAKVLGVPEDRAADTGWLHPAMGALVTELNNPPKVPPKNDPAYQLTVANRLWGQTGYTFLPDYLTLVQKSYGAGLEQLDFAGKTEESRTTINHWVEQQTHDKIKDLVPQGAIKKDTRLVLTNAIYFKSGWTEPFVKSETADGNFFTSKDKKTTAKMMTQTEEHPYYEDDSVQAVSLAYNSNVLSMVVILPKDKDGIAKVEESLKPETLKTIAGKMKGERVHVTMPRFKIEQSIEMTQVLSSLGMTLAMSPNEADFSGMTGNRDLYIGAVIHKAFVNVDEEGTEAAAATAVMMRAMSMPVGAPKEFNANHPFLFVIRHRETGAILFIGRVSEPKI